ncbi:hypothetical protein SAMN05443661_12137 [Natronobacterium gregoryi]|uniref:Uncharacterized protein n=2 Tax=Natronobacterium gregoryi TaxID=44930 RepID=L0AMF5_NATGS|nr:hypothetical protein Natgr_3500 [Natronobacterium gregoryi SP2]ELY72559.1 hypothetical protein C490_03183 [Natronobacterium gregoryi SP2]PLK19805.1 hypothetical protein CYV19_12920 [Natronobacterium gregoryi SP2]SFJ30620.1 hypothetical protein SAMN05443661_12137 [Natronobacterium gregoryi]
MFGLFSSSGSSEQRPEVTINQDPRELTISVKGKPGDDTQDVVDMVATAFRDRARNGIDVSPEDGGELVLKQDDDGVHRLP